MDDILLNFGACFFMEQISIICDENVPFLDITESIPNVNIFLRLLNY